MALRNTTINRGLNGLHPLSYMGDNPTTPPDFYSINRDPGPNDWQDFTLCDYWLNTTTQSVWVLVSLNNNVAKWVMFAGGSGAVLFLTSNVGGPVPPLAGNINVVGDGVGITGVGNPATNTITFSLVGGGQAAQSFVTDSGTATPIAGVIDIFAQPQAGSSVTFSASTNVIRLNTSDSNFNTIIGAAAGNATITGGGNIGLGGFALHACTSGFNNTAIGFDSLMNLTTGFRNTAVGLTAGQDLTTGNGNAFIGYEAGTGLISGSNNIGLGQSSAGSYAGAESNNIMIAHPGVVGESNICRIGNNTAPLLKTFIGGIAGVTTDVNDAVAVLISASTGQLGTVSSSKRYKKNIKDMGIMSENIMELRPVIFNYKHSDHLCFGLIAEEVEEVFPNLVVYNNEGLPETVKYHDLVPMLLNELQKLSERVEELESL